MNLNNKISNIFIKIKKIFNINCFLGYDDMLIDSEKKFVNSNNKIKIYTKEYYEKIESKFDKAQLNLFTKYNSLKSKFYDQSDSLESKIKLPLKFGLILALMLFIFGFGWMAFAKIDGAAVAPGQIVFASNKQNVQIAHGGIIKNILAKDGDFVLKGQTLVKLEDTELKANYNSSKNHLYALRITEERLIAEKNNYEKFIPSIEIKNQSQNNEDLKEILNSQIRFFDANKEFFKTNLDIMSQKKIQLEKEIIGLKSQEKSLKEQIQFNEEELDAAEKLLKDGAISKSRLLALKSHNSQLIGSLGNIQAGLSRAIQQIAEIEIQKINLKNNKLKEIEDSLKNLSIEIINGQEKIIAISDALEKTTIKAQISGNINNLKFKKQGEVVPPGSIIMEILPENDNLIIEARLFTKDINQLLRAGFDLKNYNYQDINKLFNAKIQIPSYSGRRFNKLQGSVFYVGSDIIIDQRMGFPYYLIKIMISKKELIEASKRKMKIFPGMEANVFILTEARTPLSYFISPISSAFDTAMIDS
jgi:HlyD family secretion protein